MASAGAAGAVGFTLYTGRHNASALLMAIFAVWVLSPFFALLVMNIFSKDWPALYLLTMLITVGTLAIYGEVAFGPPRPKPAAVFVIVPPVSWLLIGAAALFRWRSRDHVV